MDRVIFGDNQFFGINHMSEEKAQNQAERFKDIGAIIRVIDTAYDCGIHSFMFNTHDRVAEICDHFRTHPERYPDLQLYPSMPYAHKYANAVNQKGMVRALSDFIFTDRTAGQVLNTIFRGSMSVLNRDMLSAMRLLIDGEMRMFRGLNVKMVFLQNIVTDLLLGLGASAVFSEYSDYIKGEYGVEAAFNTMNMPMLVDFLLECGIENPIVCSSINKCGYLMSPSRESYEVALREKESRPIAMSILASGALSPSEAIDYVCQFPSITSIVFGASSRQHIEETKAMIDESYRID